MACELQVKQRVVPREMNVRPVRNMIGIGGSSKAILVQGGNSKDQPDALTMLPCEEISAFSSTARRGAGGKGASESTGKDDAPLLVGPRQLPSFGQDIKVGDEPR